MQGAHTDRLIHFARTDGSLACGRLLDKEAGTSLTWPAVTCPDCLTARRRRQRNVILAGVGSGVTVIVVALVLWLVLSMDSQGEDAVAVEPETIPTAIAPIATATVAPATPEVDPTLAEIQLTKEPVEAAAMAQPRRGARLQWIESSPTLHLLVDAEHPDYALAKLEGRGNCWYVVGVDDERLQGACTAFGVAQGNARTLANQTLACPPEQPMCANPDYIFVQWMRSRVSIASGETITVATDCADETMIEIKESIFGFGGPRTENYRSYTAPSGYYEQTFRAPSLASGGSLNHMLQPAVSGIGECWIGFRDFRP